MRSVFRTCAIFVALSLVPSAIACAVTDDAAPSTVDDGGSVTPAGDASVGDEPDASEAEAPRECSEEGFCHTKLPPHQTLRAVWGDGQGVVWAVSGQGAILRWDQSSWKIHTSGLGWLAAVWGSGPTDVWVGGVEGVYHGTGASPATLKFERTTRVPGEARSIWGTSADDVWAVLVGEDGSSPPSRVLHYTRGADASAPEWTAVTDLAPDEQYTHVWGSALSGVWLGAAAFEPNGDRRGHVYRRAPSASAFESALPDGGAIEDIVSVSVLSDTSAVLLGRTIHQDEVLRRVTSADNGQTFAVGGAELYREFNALYNYALWTYAIGGVARGDLWAAGVSGQIRHFDGREWNPCTLAVTKYPVVASFYGIWAKSPDDAWFVGDNVALHLDSTKK